MCMRRVRGGGRGEGDGGEGVCGGRQKRGCVWRETEVRMCVERDRGEITERSFIHDLPIHWKVSNPSKCTTHTYIQRQSHLFTQGREGSCWCERKTFMTEVPYSLQ